LDKHIEPLNEREIRAAAGKHRPAEIIVLGKTGSLMDDAAELAGRDNRHGTVLVAEEQTAGRGRHGRTWESPRGLGLYIAVILDEKRTGEPGSMLSIISGLAACEAVHGAGVSTAVVKWPNDVLVGEKKTAGILVSKKMTAGAYIVGTGINVHHREDDFPPEIEGTATSIYLEIGRDVSRNRVAGLLVRSLFEKNLGFMKWGPQHIMGDYKNQCVTLGKEVEITEKGEVYNGMAEDITDDGALLVRTGAGVKAFYTGEASINW
jgi:BirA family biotin operon repressor/biotin-[acetyl-CoA-carboxylase] ligase